MARSKTIYTLKEVAGMVGENLELLGEITTNSDNIAEGEMVHVRDASEYGTRGLVIPPFLMRGLRFKRLARTRGPPPSRLDRQDLGQICCDCKRG